MGFDQRCVAIGVFGIAKCPRLAAGRPDITQQKRSIASLYRLGREVLSVIS
jgi:hypothetical protein